MSSILRCTVRIAGMALGDRFYARVKETFLLLPGGLRFLKAVGYLRSDYSTGDRETGASLSRLHFATSCLSWDAYINYSQDETLPEYDVFSPGELQADSVQEIWWDDDADELPGPLIVEFFRILMPSGRLHIRGQGRNDMMQHGFYFLDANGAFQEFYKRVPLPSSYRDLNEDAWESKIRKRPEKFTLEWRRRHISYKAIREVLAVLKPQRLVSFGCGAGQLEILIAPEVESVIGVDISTRALKIGQELQADRDARVAFVAGAGQIPLADSIFDLCILLEVMEHIYPDDMRRILAEIRRILKPGGYLYLTTPNGREYWDPGHVQFYTKELLFQTAQKNDWEVVWIEIEDRRDCYRRHDMLKALWRKKTP